MTMSALIRDVEAKLGRKMEAEVVVKNGVELEGIRLSGETFTPIVYPGEFPEEMEYAEMVNAICEAFEEFLKEKGSGTAVESFQKYISEKDFLMENIYVGMQRSGSEDIVKRESEFPGIEEYLHVRQDVSDGCYSAKVKEEILKNAGVTLAEAWTAAEKKYCGGNRNYANERDAWASGSFNRYIYSYKHRRFKGRVFNNCKIQNQGSCKFNRRRKVCCASIIHS